MASALIGTIAFPFLLSMFGINYKIGVVIGNTIITSFAVAYTRYFIESKRGFSLGFLECIFYLHYRLQ